jgi:hypothetical protein
MGLCGALFETMVVNGFRKNSCNTGVRALLHFWRNDIGTEVDLILERGNFSAIYPGLVYGGDTRFTRDGVDVMPWAGL